MAAAGSRLDALIGVALALGSGLLWGCSDFWGGMISRRIPVLAVSLVSQGIGFVVLGSMFSTLFGARIVSLALLAAAVGITRTSLRQPRPSLLQAGIVGAGDVTANALFALAAARGCSPSSRCSAASTR